MWTLPSLFKIGLAPNDMTCQMKVTLGILVVRNGAVTSTMSKSIQGIEISTTECPWKTLECQEYRFMPQIVG